MAHHIGAPFHLITMARDFAYQFYNSQRWKDCRESYAKSKRYLCEDCLAKGLYTPGEIVHHIQPLTPENINDPGITLSFNNLRLVCRKCHGEEHAYKERRYVIDEQGGVHIKID